MAVVTTPVALFVVVTVVPGIRPPPASVTVPLNEALVDWLSTGNDAASISRVATTVALGKQNQKLRKSPSFLVIIEESPLRKIGRRCSATANPRSARQCVKQSSWRVSF